jgi:hypothetical protein
VTTGLQTAGHRRFVLSSGCTLAVETPFENVEALVNRADGASPSSDSPSAATGSRGVAADGLRAA